MGLPRNSSNRVAWKLSNQPSFGARVAKKCDDLCRASVLGKGKILNKSKFLWEQFSAGRVSCRKMPYLITRWRVVEPFFKFLFKSKIHPYYTFPFKEHFVKSEFDFKSPEMAKGSNEPNKIFNQLIRDSRKSEDEAVIYTDGSRTGSDSINAEDNLMGCAIFIPNIILRLSLTN